MKDQMLQQKYNQRALKDRLARYFVALGGIGVIIAILLIFFYLLQVVIPMFESADIKESHSYANTGQGNTLHLGLEEQGTIGVRFTDLGHVIFFKTDTGEVVKDTNLNLPATITSISSKLDFIVLGLANGQVKVVRYVFDISYPDNVRTLTPVLEFPLGEDLLEIDESGKSLVEIDIQINDGSIGLVAKTNDMRLVFARYTQEESFISEQLVTELAVRSEQKN